MQNLQILFSLFACLDIPVLIHFTINRRLWSQFQNVSSYNYKPEWVVPHGFVKNAKHICPNWQMYLFQIAISSDDGRCKSPLNGCSAWSVFFMPIRQPPLVSSHMSPAVWPLLLTGNKLASTSHKSLLKWNLHHHFFRCTLRAFHTIAISVEKLVAPKMAFSSTRPNITGIYCTRALQWPSPWHEANWYFIRNVTYTSQSAVVPIMSGERFPILSQTIFDWSMFLIFRFFNSFTNNLDWWVFLTKYQPN